MPRHGLKFKMYVADASGLNLATADIVADPTYALLTNARDLSMPDEVETAENKDRGSGYVGEFPGHHTLALEGSVSYAPSDTAYATLRTAFLANTLVAVMLLDDLVSVDGALGECFVGYVTSFPLSAAMAEGASRNFRIGLAADGVDPEQVSISVA